MRALMGLHKNEHGVWRVRRKVPKRLAGITRYRSFAIADALNTRGTATAREGRWLCGDGQAAYDVAPLASYWPG